MKFIFFALFISVMLCLKIANGQVMSISTCKDLNNIRYNSSKDFVLINDIDCSSFPIWTPLPTFTGSLDGGCHTISNLVLTVNNNNFGLFSQLQGSTIKNLVITQSTIQLNTSNLYNIAFLVGYMTPGSNVINCSVSNSKIIGASALITGIVNVGGVVGNNNAGLVQGCVTTNLYVSVYSITYLGFNVGFTTGNVTGCKSYYNRMGPLQDWSNIFSIGGNVGYINTGGIVSFCDSFTNTLIANGLVSGNIGIHQGLLAHDLNCVNNTLIDQVGGLAGNIAANFGQSKNLVSCSNIFECMVPLQYASGNIFQNEVSSVQTLLSSGNTFINVSASDNVFTGVGGSDCAHSNNVFNGGSLQPNLCVGTTTQLNCPSVNSLFPTTGCITKRF